VRDLRVTGLVQAERWSRGSDALPRRHPRALPKGTQRSLSHSLDHRTVLGGIVRGRIVPHMRLTCGMRWQPSQGMVLSKVASTLGIDSEEEALQTLRGQPPHSAPIAPYAMTS
jgi:hypothetical protein